jgi:hypothetical protein
MRAWKNLRTSKHAILDIYKIAVADNKYDFAKKSNFTLFAM